MENLNRMTKAEEGLITPVIDAQMLFIIIKEEQNAYFEAEEDQDTKRIEKRIFEARDLKKKYLTLLN